MGHKFRNLYAYETKPKNSREAFEKVEEKDEYIKSRKQQLVNSIRELAIAEGVGRPGKKLTIKTLRRWVETYPDKFLGLSDIDSILRTYFFGSIENLRFVLSRTNE